MLYKVGRFLQLLGLLIVPAGIAGNLAREEQIPLKVSLAISGAGVAVFYLGRLIQNAARPP